MLFYNIPEELRILQQWVCWKYVTIEGTDKPTKVPYNARTGYPASVKNPNDWSSFEEAVAAFQNGYCDGIGFVFTADDPYTGIDLDDVQGDQVKFDRQHKIYEKFNSYSELSPSGKGLHIIVKGSVPHGRKREAVEVYSKERYFTFTGDVVNAALIQERQELLDTLFEEMGGQVPTHAVLDDEPQTMSDEQIIYMARTATNGAKFEQLYSGDWASLYPKEDGSGDWSRADLALVDILAFYSRNKEQVIRIWRNSQLGARPKANREDYANYMIGKMHDNQIPLIDPEMIKNALEAAKRGTTPGGIVPQAANATGNAVQPFTAAPRSHKDAKGSIVYPPGLIGAVAEFFYKASPRQVKEISLAGALTFIAGICGRAYNISGTGLNQYILLIAKTGRGKEAINRGIGILTNTLRPTCPVIDEFIGPSYFASAPALIKTLADKPCFSSVWGDFGAKLKSLSLPVNLISTHDGYLQKAFLDLYNKSGANDMLNAMAYADKEKNTTVVRGPALTFLGETNPTEFYSGLSEQMVSTGFLPRFLVFNYGGKRAYLNRSFNEAKPTNDLIKMLGNFVATCKAAMTQNQVMNIPITPEAQAMIFQYDEWTTDEINRDESNVASDIWNRAVQKVYKLAGLLAVGINPYSPVVGRDEVEYAMSFVTEDCQDLMNKFHKGEIGAAAMGEGEQAQLKDLSEAIALFLTEDISKLKAYRIEEAMKNDGVLPVSSLLMKVSAKPSFKNDKYGSKMAFERALKILAENDDIRYMPIDQMVSKYGKRSRAIVISNPKAFF